MGEEGKNLQGCLHCTVHLSSNLSIAPNLIGPSADFISQQPMHASLWPVSMKTTTAMGLTAPSQEFHGDQPQQHRQGRQLGGELLWAWDLAAVMVCSGVGADCSLLPTCPSSNLSELCSENITLKTKAGKIQLSGCIQPTRQTHLACRHLPINCTPTSPRTVLPPLSVEGPRPVST